MFDVLFPMSPSNCSYSIRAERFLNSYRNGLDGKEAAWAAKKYRGHRTLPPGWQDALKLANLA